MTYRVDKDEFKSGMAMARNNIIQLFTKDGDTKRRELIVRGREPLFKHSHNTQYSYFEKQKDVLNVDQRKAVEKVLTAYARIMHWYWECLGRVRQRLLRILFELWWRMGKVFYLRRILIPLWTIFSSN